MMDLLRDHSEQGLRYSWINGALNGPCAHAGGLIAATQTTGSWVAELKPGAIQHWATATSTPCLSVFKPVSINQPVDFGPWPREQFDARHYWWRHERRVRAMLQATKEFTAERDAVEADWLQNQPPSTEAFTQSEQWLDAQAQPVEDRRPWYARRYWKRRNAWAAIKQPGYPGPESKAG